MFDARVLLCYPPVVPGHRPRYGLQHLETRWQLARRGSLAIAGFDTVYWQKRYWQRRATGELYLRPAFLVDPVCTTLSNPRFFLHVLTLASKWLPEPGVMFALWRRRRAKVLLDRCPSLPEARYGAAAP